jgi:phosphoribosylformimino-5-aminoimidazole carboxamide ribotide isomerase
MKLIPAIDLLDGKVVRLKKGDYNQVTEYPITPLEQAKLYEQAGFERLHVVDLNGAKEGSLVNVQLIRDIVDQTTLKVQTGGGVRSRQDAVRLFDLGFDKIVVGSLAIQEPEVWMELLKSFGGHKCILGMDLKQGRIATAGWLETTEISLETMLRPQLDAGLKEVLCTDIQRDGMLSGPNLELYQRLMQDFPDVDVIASGGIRNVEDLRALDQAGLSACVVGRAYYEGHLSLDQMQRFRA